MLTDRLITVAIHTFDRAQKMKAILEQEGIRVVLQNVNLTNPAISAGVRLRIRECDLPMALRLIENIEIISPRALADSDDDGRIILVPVDFSECSAKAVTIAFRIAALHKASVAIVHSFIDPAFVNQSAMQFTDSLTFETGVPAVDPVEEMEEEKTVEEIARSGMKKFAADIRDRIKSGALPPVKFTTEILEGLPEEVVDEYAERHKVSLIVMGTKGAGARDRELLGSVTAEVLDACKAPLLTVTPGLDTSSLASLSRVAFFAQPAQSDILAIDAMVRFFGDSHLDVTLVRLPRGRFASQAPDAMDKLLRFCRETYPGCRFTLSDLSLANPVDDLKQLMDRHTVDMMALATRHKNVFSRLFNPSWAHKILFRADIPLLSIPVQS